MNTRQVLRLNKDTFPPQLIAEMKVPKLTAHFLRSMHKCACIQQAGSQVEAVNE